jgi:hypothetical protein
MLWSALAELGMFASTDQLDRTNRTIARLGQSQLARTRSISGRITWWRGLLATGYPLPRHGVIRILGMGQALTGFVIAPLHLAPSHYEQALRIGMLSNLIVTLYDAFLDSGRTTDNPLPADVLACLVDRNSRREFTRMRRRESGPRRLMVSLIGAYFDALEALPYAQQRPQIMSTLISAIHRMYEGQNRSAQLPYGALGRRAHRALRAKSIYPIMIMGLPAWLLLPEVPAGRGWWHLRWMCRLGAFLGWVDDVVDLWLDSRLDQPNAAASHRATNGDSLADRAAFTRQIAARGRRLVDEWATEVGDLNAVPEAARSALGVCLYSWFGGPPD